MNDTTEFVLGLIVIGAVVQFVLLMRQKRRNGTIGVRDHLQQTRRAGRIVAVTIVVALLMLALFNIIVERAGH